MFEVKLRAVGSLTILHLLPIPVISSIFCVPLSVCTQRVQEELFQASYRLYLSAPWFGLKTYIQVADAILLFSVCASYGVAAGIFFASAHDKKTKKEA